jgi:hypothetical protein
MTYTDLIQESIYVKKDGYNVINSGSVVIEGIEHRINNGWVYCDLSLQNKAFDITPKKDVCPKCFPDYKKVRAKISPIQLKLF